MQNEVTIHESHTNGHLSIPDARHQPVPRDWAVDVALSVIEAADWEALDEMESSLKALASYIESMGQDGVEYEKALRIVERRRGELLHPDAPHGGDRRSEEFQVSRTLLENVSPMTASRYRKLARAWDAVVWPHLLSATEKYEVSQSACLRLVHRHERESAIANEELEVQSHVEVGNSNLYHGDFRETLSVIPDQSIDLIVTDPPYPKEDLPLWSDLSAFAARTLGDRGILFAWTGQIFLPEVIRRLSEHLNYGWTYALMLPGSGSRIMGRHIIQGWKPIVAFTRNAWPSGEWADDVLISPSREKSNYEWEQNGAPALRLIERHSADNALVVDPFMGVGTFGLAAQSLGRRFIGCELDPGRYNKSIIRLQENADT